MSSTNPKSARIALSHTERKEKYRWRNMPFTRGPRESDRRDTAMERGTHIDEGFPHINRRGRCMCLQTCCQNEKGCKCRLCICKAIGKDHSELASILANTILSTGEDGEKNGKHNPPKSGGRNNNG